MCYTELGINMYMFLIFLKPKRYINNKFIFNKQCEDISEKKLQVYAEAVRSKPGINVNYDNYPYDVYKMSNIRLHAHLYT